MSQQCARLIQYLTSERKENPPRVDRLGYSCYSNVWSKVEYEKSTNSDCDWFVKSAKVGDFPSQLVKRK